MRLTKKNNAYKKRVCYHIIHIPNTDGREIFDLQDGPERMLLETIDYFVLNRNLCKSPWVDEVNIQWNSWFDQNSVKQNLLKYEIYFNAFAKNKFPWNVKKKCENIWHTILSFCDTLFHNVDANLLIYYIPLQRAAYLRYRER